MKWIKLVALAGLSEVLLIASAVVFMAVYSYLIHPGEKAAFYEARAPVLVPYLAIVVSLPLFYWLSRWTAGWRHALIFWCLHEVIDMAISFAVTPLWVVSQALKLLGCWLGSRNLKH